MPRIRGPRNLISMDELSDPTTTCPLCGNRDARLKRTSPVAVACERCGEFTITEAVFSAVTGGQPRPYLSAATRKASGIRPTAFPGKRELAKARSATALYSRVREIERSIAADRGRFGSAWPGLENQACVRLSSDRGGRFIGTSVLPRRIGQARVSVGSARSKRRLGINGTGLGESCSLFRGQAAFPGGALWRCGFQT